MGARVRWILPPLLILTACRATLPGEELESQALREEGEAYVKPFEERELPAVNADSPYGEMIARAVHSDPAIEAAYFEWAMAYHQAIAAGTPPDPTFGFGWMVDDPVGTITNNVMALLFLPLPAPEKRQAEARVKWEEMKGARSRYDSMMAVRRGRFRQAYAQFDRAAREAELGDREIEILVGLETNLTDLAGSGRVSTAAILQSRLELEQARDRAAAARAAVRVARARVNTLMAREPGAPLDAPPLEPLTLDATEEAILALALLRNPDVVSREGQLRAARAGLDLAESQDNADFAFQYERQFSDQFMLQFTLPLQRDRIHALLGEARARLAKAEADRRQARNEILSETAAAFQRFREAERRQALIAGRLKPLATAAFDALVARFGAGSATFLELIEAKRALLEVEREEARARTEREDAVGDLLACCGAEIPRITPTEASALAQESRS
jgi:outer membrane protein TolC